MNEDLAAELIAAAVVNGNDLSLRIAAAKVLDLEGWQPLTFTYRVAELVLRAVQPTFDITLNGDGPHDN